MEQAPADTQVPLPQVPLRVMADWFYADGAARNLAPRTLEFYRCKLAYLVTAAGDRLPQDISAHHLRLIVQHYREKRAWSATSVNHFITAMRAFFNFLVDEGVLEVSPASKVDHLKVDEHLPDPLTQKEIVRLLEGCGESFCGVRDRAVFLVFLDTGMRLGEVLRLNLADVDLALGQIRIRQAKSRKERLVPFSGTTRRALIHYLTQRATRSKVDAVWVTEDGTAFTRWYFIKRLERIAREAGVAGFHLHRLRHTMATQFLRNGGNAMTLQRILGHASSRMTQRYCHLTDADAQADHNSASPVEGWGLEARRRQQRRTA